jgi:hypothetical protein
MICCCAVALFFSQVTSLQISLKYTSSFTCLLKKKSQIVPVSTVKDTARHTVHLLEGARNSIAGKMATRAPNNAAFETHRAGTVYWTSRIQLRSD